MICASSKNTFIGDGNLQMIWSKINFLCEYFIYCFNPVLCIVLVSPEILNIIVRADYMKDSSLNRLVCWPGKISAGNIWNFPISEERMNFLRWTSNWSESSQPLKCLLTFYFKNLLSKSCKSIFYVSVVNYYGKYIFKGFNYKFFGLPFKTYFKDTSFEKKSQWLLANNHLT